MDQITAQTLTWPDYLVGAIFLLISTLIGFYFMRQDRKLKQLEKLKKYTYNEVINSPSATGGIVGQPSPTDTKSLIHERASLVSSSNDSKSSSTPPSPAESNESLKNEIHRYHLASRQLHFLPISCSLTASFISALTILGWPVEIYKYGTMFVYFSVTYLVAALICIKFFIPFFYNSNHTTIYDYLLARFDSKVLILITKAVYIMQTCLYAGIVIYAPSLALSTMNIGISLWPAIALTAAICTLYTTLGGIKAVVWTDVVQSVVMVSGFVVICWRGIQLYGFTELIETAERHQIFQLDNFSFDLRVRHSFWAIVVGGCLGLWLPTYAVNQTEVQRYMACKSLTHARLALLTTVVIKWVLLVLSAFCGFVMAKFFEDNAPPKEYIKDQYIPYLILNIFHIPGLLGLYTASIYSGTLSTVSSAINSLSTVVVSSTEFSFIKRKPLLWSKILVVFFGGCCFLTAVLAEYLGGILEAAMSVNSIVFSPTLGLFILAIWCKSTNKIGAIVGYVSGVLTGAVLYLTTKSCASNENAGSVIEGYFKHRDFANLVDFDSQALAAFDDTSSCNVYLSYLYISVCGLIVSLFFGFMTSNIYNIFSSNETR